MKLESLGMKRAEPRTPGNTDCYGLTKGQEAETDLGNTGAKGHMEQVSRKANWSKESNTAQKRERKLMMFPEVCS